MAADYPGAIKNFLALEDGVDTVLAQHMNERGDEITAIETELGADVAGSMSDLVARLTVVLEDNGALKADSVITTTLKTATSEQSTGAAGASVAVTGGAYCFWPQVKGSTTTNDVRVAPYWNGVANLTTSYATYVYLYEGGADTVYSQFRYVTSSGRDHWIWLLIDKVTREILCSSSAPDHPSYGNGGDKEAMPHPFKNYDETKHEIVLIDKKTCNDLKKESKDTKKSMLTLLNESYSPDMEKEEAYEPLHSGQFLGEKPVLIEKIPDYIKVRKLKRRVV